MNLLGGSVRFVIVVKKKEACTVRRAGSVRVSQALEKCRAKITRFNGYNAESTGRHDFSVPSFPIIQLIIKWLRHATGLMQAGAGPFARSWQESWAEW
jgi:hypothetical protein